MNYNAPNDFSYDFELNLNKIPAKRSDRIALSLLVPGLLCALFLIMLGFFELCHGFHPKDVDNIVPFWFSFIVFDVCLKNLG